MPLISVIVPVYNIEAYVRRSVDSILKQTLTDLEIILVDDGSTDNSGKICDEYLQRDSRVKVIHKAHGGVSAARNAGLDSCTGEYIGFVDGDDYIDEDMYELLYGNAKKYEADISMCKFRRIYPNRIEDTSLNKEVIITDKEEIIKELYCGKIGISVCSKLYKRKIFETLKFKIGKTYEDVYITLHTVELANTFVLCYKAKYNYIERSGSITEQKTYNKKIKEEILAYKYNDNFIWQKFPGLKEVSNYRMYWVIRVTIERILKCKDGNEHMDEVYRLQGMLRDNIAKIMTNKYLSWKQRVAYLLVCVNYKLYMKIREKIR